MTESPQTIIYLVQCLWILIASLLGSEFISEAILQVHLPSLPCISRQVQ